MSDDHHKIIRDHHLKESTDPTNYPINQKDLKHGFAFTSIFSKDSLCLDMIPDLSSNDFLQLSSDRILEWCICHLFRCFQTVSESIISIHSTTSVYLFFSPYSSRAIELSFPTCSESTSSDQITTQLLSYFYYLSKKKYLLQSPFILLVCSTPYGTNAMEQS